AADVLQPLEEIQSLRVQFAARFTTRQIPDSADALEVAADQRLAAGAEQDAVAVLARRDLLQRPGVVGRLHAAAPAARPGRRLKRSRLACRCRLTTALTGFGVYRCCSCLESITSVPSRVVGVGRQSAGGDGPAARPAAAGAEGAGAGGGRRPVERAGQSFHLAD